MSRRLLCVAAFLPVILTMALGYPSTSVSSVHHGPGHLVDERESADPGSTTDLLAEATVAEDAEPEESDDGHDDAFMEAPEADEPGTVSPTTASQTRPVTSKDNAGMPQHFFPSFAPVFSLGHSRPPQLFHQEQYFSKSRAAPPPLGPDYNPFRAYRESSYKVPITVDDDPTSSNILGSGNFGVLKGGTYYNDEDRGELGGGLFNPYYSNNGHGRPYTANPRPQKYSSGDFFANFRDFADINTPNKPAFSEYVVVYVNKNATKDEAGVQAPLSRSGIRPKNIIEQLSLLDIGEEDAGTESSMTPTTTTTTPAPEKKVSQHKRKLALLKKAVKDKEKSTQKKREQLEPLLALS